MNELIKKINLKTPDVKLFSDTAESIAHKISEAKRANKSTQIRKFYDELVLWDSRVNSFSSNEQDKIAKYDKFAPFIQMLRAKTSYAQGRGHVDNSFEIFFSDMISKITSAEDLHYAKLLMEAVIGFRKGLESSRA